MRSGSSKDRAIPLAIRSRRRLFRDTLAASLTRQPDLTVVGHVADDRDLLQLCALRGPELVLFDADAPISAELNHLAEVRDRFTQTRIVLMYDELSPADLAATHRIGVETLVPTSHGLRALLVVLRQQAAILRRGPSRPAPPGDLLTDEEQEIIALLSAGHTVQRIASLLDQTPFAVENAKRRIYHKVGVASQNQVVARAAALGLVEEPVPGGPAGTGWRTPAAAAPDRPSVRLPQLTPREADILSSIVLGHTVRQTARLLTIAEKTVENIQTRLFLKLGTRNRAEAIAAAYSLGLSGLVTDAVPPESTPKGKAFI